MKCSIPLVIAVTIGLASASIVPTTSQTGRDDSCVLGAARCGDIEGVCTSCTIYTGLEDGECRNVPGCPERDNSCWNDENGIGVHCAIDMSDTSTDVVDTLKLRSDECEANALGCGDIEGVCKSCTLTYGFQDGTCHSEDVCEHHDNSCFNKHNGWLTACVPPFAGDVFFHLSDNTPLIVREEPEEPPENISMVPACGEGRAACGGYVLPSGQYCDNCMIQIGDDKGNCIPTKCLDLQGNLDVPETCGSKDKGEQACLYGTHENKPIADPEHSTSIGNGLLTINGTCKPESFTCVDVAGECENCAIAKGAPDATCVLVDLCGWQLSGKDGNDDLEDDTCFEKHDGQRPTCSSGSMLSVSLAMVTMVAIVTLYAAL